MLELNFKVSARKMAVIVIILLAGWGIISFAEVLTSLYRQNQSDSSKKILKSALHGDIVITDILLNLPDEFVVIPPSTPKNNQWFFEGYTWSMVLDLLKSAKLSDQALHVWITETPRHHDKDGIKMMPTDQQILELSPESRSILYPALTGMPANVNKNEVVCFKPDTLKKIIEDSGLSQKSIALLKQLLYSNPKSQLLIFSDWDVALRQIPSDEEKRLFIKTLSLKPSLLAEVQITPETNVVQLANYWGQGGRRKDVEPLLNSLQSLKSNADISVMCLLPAFIQNRLYTYPFPSSDNMDIQQDCFWTALNTFNLKPDDQMHDMDYIRKYLDNECYKIYEPSQLGDIICLSIGDGKVIHAATCITPDIVFTKNGYNFTQPWILMHKSDMLDTYQARYPNTTLQPIYFRNRTM